MRRELRSSDRALSDLRTELWQAQERARRLATEVWRMDGERSRLRAVQGQLGAELSCVLSLLRLRPPPPAALPAADCMPSDWELELHALVHAAGHLRAAVDRGGVLVEASSVDAERAGWQEERETLHAELDSLRRAARARELRETNEREAEEDRAALLAEANARLRQAKQAEAAAKAAEAQAAAARGRKGGGGADEGAGRIARGGSQAARAVGSRGGEAARAVGGRGGESSASGWRQKRRGRGRPRRRPSERPRWLGSQPAGTRRRPGLVLGCRRRPPPLPALDPVAMPSPSAHGVRGCWLPFPDAATAAAAARSPPATSVAAEDAVDAADARE